jgi:hypothetical protein
MNQLAHVTVSTEPISDWFAVHPALGIASIDHLYNRMDGAYPHKWRANFPDVQSITNWRESWVEAFEEEALTFNEVKRGIRECRRLYAWPPSISEFLIACRPVLEPMAAYQEAVSGLAERERGEPGVWSSLAVFWAAVSLAYDLKMQTYGQIKARWESALTQQMAKGAWDPIPDIALGLEYSPIVDTEMTKKVVNDLRATWKREDAAFDHKRWARKLDEKLSQGDKSVPIMAAKMAHEALGVGVPA